MTRYLIRLGAVVFLLALAAGLAVMAAGTIATGDWYAFQLPWSGIGMALITIGLAGSAIFMAVEDLVEPIGRWRLLALPGIAVAAFLWFVLLVVGLPHSGACCDQPSQFVPTLLYSAPQLITALVAALAISGLPLLLGRRRPAASE